MASLRKLEVRGVDNVENAIELIPYHELGKNKYASLDMAYPLEDMAAYKHEDAVAVKKKLEDAGVRVILSSF